MGIGKLCRRQRSQIGTARQPTRGCAWQGAPRRAGHFLHKNSQPLKNGSLKERVNTGIICTLFLGSRTHGWCEVRALQFHNSSSLEQGGNLVSLGNIVSVKVNVV
jgi:hypothetical protein